MKRLLYILIISTLSLCLAACGIPAPSSEQETSFSSGITSETDLSGEEGAFYTGDPKNADTPQTTETTGDRPQDSTPIFPESSTSPTPATSDTRSSAFTTTTTTRSTATTQPTTTAPEKTEDYQHAILRLVNQERAKTGLSELVLDDTVSRAARIRAREIISVFSHTRPDGTSCFTALDEVGISSSRVTRAENIAAGQRSPEAVMESWMNSEGHRANILNPHMKKLGVGYAEGGQYRTNWVQMFIG